MKKGLEKGLWYESYIRDSGELTVPSDIPIIRAILWVCNGCDEFQRESWNLTVPRTSCERKIRETETLEDSPGANKTILKGITEEKSRGEVFRRDKQRIQVGSLRDDQRQTITKSKRTKELYSRYSTPSPNLNSLSEFKVSYKKIEGDTKSVTRFRVPYTFTNTV